MLGSFRGNGVLGVEVGGVQKGKGRNEWVGGSGRRGAILIAFRE